MEGSEIATSTVRIVADTSALDRAVTRLGKLFHALGDACDAYLVEAEEVDEP